MMRWYHSILQKILQTDLVCHYFITIASGFNLVTTAGAYACLDEREREIARWAQRIALVRASTPVLLGYHEDWFLSCLKRTILSMSVTRDCSPLIYLICAWDAE